LERASPDALSTSAVAPAIAPGAALRRAATESFIVCPAASGGKRTDRKSVV